MPSGRTHDRITLWGLPWVVLASYGLVRSAELTLIVGLAYLFSGLMFGPDLDIHSVQFKRWGIFRWIWLPYQKTLSHRSHLSHGFLIGTTLRVLYFATFLLMVAALGGAIAVMLFQVKWQWRNWLMMGGQTIQQTYWAEGLALFAGLEIGAMSHSVSDWCGSAVKRYQKQGITGILPKPKKKKAARKRSKIAGKKRRKS